jgi:hypothetical protein
LISAIESLFKGPRELFDGLWAGGSDYELTPHPVIRVSLKSFHNRITPELALERLGESLRKAAAESKVDIRGGDPASMLEGLIEDLYDLDDQAKKAAGLHEARRGVVVLVDDYDAPIADILIYPRAGEAMRELGPFYGVLRSQAERLRLVFLTGVAKYSDGWSSPASEFFDSLTDLTIEEGFAASCGFTLSEFESLFKKRLPRIFPKYKASFPFWRDKSAEDLLTLLLAYYSGYSWDGKTTLLSPYSVVNSLDSQELRDYCMDSGSVSYVGPLLNRQGLSIRDVNTDAAFDAGDLRLDLEKIDLRKYMFLNGSLAIRTDSPYAPKGADPKSFRLRLTNFDIKTGIAFGLLDDYYGDPETLGPAHTDVLITWIYGLVDNVLAFDSEAANLMEALRDKSGKDAEEALLNFMSSIRWRHHTFNQSVFKSAFLMALAVADQPFSGETGEEAKSRSDVHFQTPCGQDFILEFKHVSGKDYHPASQSGAKKKGGKGRAPSGKAYEAWVEQRMAEAAEQAMKDIEGRDYLSTGLITPQNIWKIALVSNDSGKVRFSFEAAANWTAEPAGQGKTLIKFQPAD